MTEREANTIREIGPGMRNAERIWGAGGWGGGGRGIGIESVGRRTDTQTLTLTLNQRQMKEESLLKRSY